MSVSALPTFHPFTEEEISENWQAIDIYTQLAQRAESTRYILGEMPTPVHHLKLDVLKCKIHQDIFLKVNIMQRMGVKYVPYWHYYSSAVERKSLNSGWKDGTFDALRFRRQCRREFQHGVKHRQQQLQALGIFGDWESCKNLDARNEAKIISTFSKLRELEYLNQDCKLSYWCQECSTTLGDDEVEIRPSQADSGYVKFPISTGLEEFGEDVYFLVWLQDLWHLAGSVALGVTKDCQYSIVEFGGEVHVLTEEDLFTRFPAELRKDIKMLKTCRIDILTGCTCAHPLLRMNLPVIAIPDLCQHDGGLNEEMTLPPLTGVRHLAPGHHPYDYQVAQILQLPITSVVDDIGGLTESSEQFCGLEVAEAGKFIAFELEKRGYLVYTRHETVPQPHCRTCDMPALFRPVQQWIFSVDSNYLRERVLRSDDYWEHCNSKERGWIQQTIQDLSDVCVSCQRGWGIPIPIFQCERCGYQLSDARIIKAVRDLVSRRGSDVWFKLSTEDLSHQNTVCPDCDAKELRKESTLLDGRFAVLLNAISNFKVKKNNSHPVNVCFFYTDQFHKWFAQFVLISVALDGAVPLNLELTEVDSDAQSVEVSESWLDKYPRDVLRLFAIHSTSDSLSIDTLLQQCQNEYSVVQTLCLAILSCLETFDVDKQKLSVETLLPVDALALSATNQVLQSVDLAYQQRHFHQAWCVLRNFCKSDLQRFYLPVLRDRLNVPEVTQGKKSGQTALWEILHVLIQRLAPITPFLSEQIHATIQMRNNVFSSSDCAQGENESVFLKDWISQINILYIADGVARWEQLLDEWVRR